MDDAVWMCGVCCSSHPASQSACNEPVNCSRDPALPGVNLQGGPWPKVAVGCFLGKADACPE